MPKCMVCESPARGVIDPALAQRDLDAVDPNLNGQTPSLEMLCVQLQIAHGTGNFAFTLPQMLSHAQNCPRYVKPDAVVPTEGFVKEVEIEGEGMVPVPSNEYMMALLKAAGMINIMKHPENVKPQHLIRIMELEGGKGSLEVLMKAIQDVMKSDDTSRKGPMKPPDV